MTAHGSAFVSKIWVQSARETLINEPSRCLDNALQINFFLALKTLMFRSVDFLIRDLLFTYSYFVDYIVAYINHEVF